MKSDIQIAQEAQMLPAADIAAALGVEGDSLIPYGKYKAKIDPRLAKRLADKKGARVILVTAICPTPARAPRGACRVSRWAAATSAVPSDMAF